MLALKLRSRKPQGFTLIELLVVVIIIGILAAIALPNFIGAQDKAREASVKANMRTAQIAAESYATDAGGAYPVSATDSAYATYFPGGSSQQSGGTAGAYPVNPFTNANQGPQAGSITTPAAISSTRSSAPSSLGTPGAVYYSNVQTTSYAIQGANKTGTALGGTAPGTTLVLSNQ